MAIFYRVGDTQPPLRIEVQDLGQPIDITNLQVMVTWVKADGTYISETEATKVPPDVDGLVDYEWQSGDLDVEGPYQAMVRLKATDGSYYSLTDPPVLQIEVLPNPLDMPSVVLDDTIPQVSSYDIAVHLQIPVSEIDLSFAQSAISRARSLAYVLPQMWRRPGPLSPRDNWLMKELVTMLAAREYSISPAVTYGPFQSETIGSYQYKLKDAADLGLGLTGNGNIDGLIDYFARLMLVGDSSFDIAWPDWYQPATTQVWDPTFPRGEQG